MSDPEAQRMFEERRNMVMGLNPTSWLILRVYAGLPFRVEQQIREMHVPAYCPAETIKRRHPFDKTLLIKHKKPLLPGYVFVGQSEPDTKPFEAEVINSTRTKARWLTLGDKLCKLTDKEIQTMREAERTVWRPHFDELFQAFKEIAKGVRPKRKFMSFGDFQKLSQGKEIAA